MSGVEVFFVVVLQKYVCIVCIILSTYADLEHKKLYHIYRGSKYNKCNCLFIRVEPKSIICFVSKE